MGIYTIEMILISRFLGGIQFILGGFKAFSMTLHNPGIGISIDTGISKNLSLK